MNQTKLAVNAGIDLAGWFTETESLVYRTLVGSIRAGTVVEVGV
jgi:hypothetical protein